MGALNVSPESFHAGSIHTTGEGLLGAALAMVDAGAVLIDVGARSTAPYLQTAVSDEDERERLARAVEVLVAKVPVPISADTARPGPARAALDAGARVVNDVSGLRDPAVAALISERGAGAILMASPSSVGPGTAGGTRAAPSPARPNRSSSSCERDEGVPLRRSRPPRGPGPDAGPTALDPVASVKALLAAALARARAAGIPDERVALDPGIGFFRGEAVAWDAWDAAVLAGLGELAALGRPLCIGVSRKSFIGAVTGRPRTDDRLAGSLAATAVAVWNGAALIRAHDVAETLDAVRVAERLRQASRTL